MLNIKQSEIKKLLKLKFSIIILGLFILGSNLYSQVSGGGNSETYLLRDIGARSIAMGGAYTAIANEPTAIFYNPAGLGFFSDQPLVNSSVSALGYGRTHSSIAWAQEVYPNLGVGFGVNSFHSGEFTSRDANGLPLGTVSNHQYTLVASGAYRLESYSLGVSLKYLSNNLRGTNSFANGYALDIGTKFNVLDLFSVGVAVQNLGGMMFWNNIEEDIELVPYSIRSGIAMEYGLNEETYETRSDITGEMETVYVPATRYVLIGIDAVLDQYRVSPDLVLGLEAVLHEVIAFRGGITLYGDKKGVPQLFPMTNWGAGMSIRPFVNNNVLPFDAHFDYTISREYIKSNKIAHNFSILFLF